MILNSTNDILKVSLGAAVTTNQLSCVIGYSVFKIEATPITRSIAITNGVSNVTLVAGIANQYSPLEVKFINIYNSDTVGATVTIKYYLAESLSTYNLFKQTLAPGDTLQYTQENGFEVCPGAASISASGTAILNQVVPLAATETTLYQVPTGKYTVIGFFNVSNNAGAARDFRISITKGGGATTSKDYVHYNISVAKQTTFRDSDLEGLTLVAGDIIRCYATTANLAFTLYGKELWA